MRIMRRLAVFTSVTALACVAARASPAASDDEPAAWVTRELTFSYHGFTTTYSCDELRAKVKDILLELGARPDLQVQSSGCTRIVGPDPFAGVRIRMEVLQPAAAQGGASVAAHWKRVDLLANQDPVWALAQCELLTQIRQQVLPLFTTRNVDAVTSCQAHQMAPGSLRMKADVLVPDQTPQSAAR
jgi:hypothetical protein